MSGPVDRHSPDQDLDLAEYLGGNSRLSQRYRSLTEAADETVPPELDRSILAQARRAVAPDALATASRSGEPARSDELPDELTMLRTRRRRLLQWSVPTALAASLVLVVSIVMRSGVEHEVRGMTTLPTAPVENRLPELAKDLPSPAPARQDAVALPPNEQESAARAMAKKSSGVAVKSERVHAEQALAGSVAHRNRNADPSPDQKHDVELARETRAATSNYAAAPPPPPPEPELAAVAPTVEAPSPAVTTPVRQSTSATPTVTQSASVTAASETRANETRDLAAIAPAARMVSKERNEPPAAAAKAAPGVPAAEEVDTALLHADPEAWLKHIRQLREAGKRELADREWERFSAEYPAYPVAETDPARAPKTP